MKTVSHKFLDVSRFKSPINEVSELFCKSNPVSQIISLCRRWYRGIESFLFLSGTSIPASTQTPKESSSFHTNQDSCIKKLARTMPLVGIALLSLTNFCLCGQHNSREQGGALEERLTSCEVSLVPKHNLQRNSRSLRKHRASREIAITWSST